MFRRDSLHTAYAIETSDTLIHRLAWVFSTEGPIYSSPVIWNHTVYFASTDNNLYAVVDTSGILKWRCRLGNWIESTPTVANGRIYVGCMDHKLYVVNAETGDKINEFDLDSPISSSPVLVDSSIIGVSQEGKVYALDTISNQIKQLADLEEKVYAPLSASDGVVYIHTQEHETLYALDVQTGAMLWNLPLSSK